MWAREVRPTVIFLENVAEFRGWGPLDEHGQPIKARMGETFREWKGAGSARLRRRSPHPRRVALRRADEAPPPLPRRQVRREADPLARDHARPGEGAASHAAECIDWSIPCPSIFDRKRPLADKTLRRIALGIRKRFVSRAPSPFIVGDRGADPHPDRLRGAPGPDPARAEPARADGDGRRRRVKHALVAAFLAKHYGGNTTPGSSLARPFDTITTQDHHALVQVRAFLTAYYGSEAEGGQALGEPMRTLTTRHRLGLVTVAGAEYQIADIGMRMLEPHELLRAQFGRFASSYDLSAAKTKSAQVRLIGNSVCPEVAEALVAANLGRAAREAA
jgi:DNA (cytosine-5)-methyltransferase 1